MKRIHYRATDGAITAVTELIEQRKGLLVSADPYVDVEDDVGADLSGRVVDGKIQMPSAAEQKRAHALAAAQGERDVRLQAAERALAPLQDAADLGIATEAEQEALLAWKRYRVLLNRVPTQAGYPETIDWPQVPNQQ